MSKIKLKQINKQYLNEWRKKETDIKLASLTSLDLGPKWDENENKHKNAPKLKSNKTNKKKKNLEKKCRF